MSDLHPAVAEMMADFRRRDASPLHVWRDLLAAQEVAPAAWGLTRESIAALVDTYWSERLASQRQPPATPDEPRCTCDKELVTEHTCPLKVAIHNDESLCRCCVYCTRECAAAI